MWHSSNKLEFPGVIQQPDGSIEFSLTEEEGRAADAALNAFEGVGVHPEVADRVRNGTTAVALCRYAKDLVSLHCVGLTETEYKGNQAAICEVLIKAVAAAWKASSLSPLPVFLYHRASFLQMLGMKEDARNLFSRFLEKQSQLKMDDLDKALLAYEGTDLEHALSHAKRET